MQSDEHGMLRSDLCILPGKFRWNEHDQCTRIYTLYNIINKQKKKEEKKEEANTKTNVSITEAYVYLFSYLEHHYIKFLLSSKWFVQYQFHKFIRSTTYLFNE